MSRKKEKICFLLGLWGRKYIDLFFQYSLPSLLAEGNIPQLSDNFSLSFTFLTQKRDIDYFRNSKSIQVLEKYCTIAYESIDDLICENIYSTILTFAYDRGMKVHGYEMLNTYFVFLTADYIMADGSLMGLAKYIDKGYTGICTGNYQVNSRLFKKFLSEKFNSEKTILTISKRDMVKESFNCLHAWTMSSLIDQNLICNYKSNRFFSFANADTLIGRFYLLHMLCIKPETLNYKIGSSCDYSFIPSMCPSGNTTIINDSDDYFVLEMQDEQNEDRFKEYKSMNIKKMAASLSEWTTSQHRQNSCSSIYFHSEDLNLQNLEKKTRLLDVFINHLNEMMKNKKCKNPENHFYWAGALKSFDEQQKRKSDFHFKKFSIIDMFRKFKEELMSDKHIFCVNWKDKYHIRKEITKNIKTKQDKIFIHYETPEFLKSSTANWIKNLPNNLFWVESGSNFDFSNELDFDVCIFFCNTIAEFKSNLRKLNLFKAVKLDMNIIFVIENKKLKIGFENKIKNIFLHTPFVLLKELKVESITNNHEKIQYLLDKYFIKLFACSLMLRRILILFSLLVLGVLNAASNIFTCLTKRNNKWGLNVITIVSGKYDKKDLFNAN